MSWRTITTTDVEAELAPQEVSSINAIRGNATDLAGILSKVVRKVRSQIKAGGNQLDQTGDTIPDSLVEEVIAIARWKWLNLPGLERFKTKERKDAADNAEATLKEISSNKPDRPRVELPEVPDTTPAPVSAVTTPRRGRHIRSGSFEKMGAT